VTPALDFKISGHEAVEGKKFQIFKSDNTVETLIYRPLVINWSIEFDDQEIEILNSFGAFRYEMGTAVGLVDGPFL
jgi:hypothetical protein